MATSVARQPIREGMSYLQLVRTFPLRPLRSERELDRALSVIDSLLDAKSLKREARDYLEVLSSLVEQFEEENHIIKAAPDAEMLAHLIDAKGTTQAELARHTQIAESTISSVLRGHRMLTREHIAKLSKYFHVRVNAFDFDASRS